MDDGQFVALMQPHIAAAVRVATAMLGVADAEDAVQEAFVRAWQAWPSLRDVAAMRPWLLRIVVNVCHTWLRGSFGDRRHRSIPLTEDVIGLGDDIADSAHVDALDLAEAIAGLEPPLRTIVQLRYFGGLDATEMGAVLHISPATIRTRLRRALVLLRTALQPDDHLAVSESQEAEL